MAVSKIDLQNKTEALPARIESYWFENDNIGLKNTLFNRVYIPLKPFDSGLDYEDQPVETEIVLEWYKLELADPAKLDGLDLNHDNYADAEGSVYIGGAHNWCNVKQLSLEITNSGSYTMAGKILVEFEGEGVAENELFSFVTTGAYTPT